MTADIELLPLPRTLQHADDADLATHVQDYARACVAHATAAKDDEIESLRVRADAMAGEAIKHEARAERLAEAIKAYKSECDNPAKDYVLRAKRRDEMFALLHGHDQEVGNG